MTKRIYGHTRDGRPIDDEMIEQFADEAERGYDPEQLKKKPRGRGRPPLGAGAKEVESIRIEPELRDLVGQQPPRRESPSPRSSDEHCANTSRAHKASSPSEQPESPPSESPREADAVKAGLLGPDIGLGRRSASRRDGTVGRPDRACSVTPDGYAGRMVPVRPGSATIWPADTPTSETNGRPPDDLLVLSQAEQTANLVNQFMLDATTQDAGTDATTDHSICALPLLSSMAAASTHIDGYWTPGASAAPHTS
jgi:hypothetical protein